MTMVLGLAGSFVGFLIFAELLDIGDEDAFDLGGIIGAIIGAMLLLFLYERFVGGPSRPVAPISEPDARRERTERQGKRDHDRRNRP